MSEAGSPAPEAGDKGFETADFAVINPDGQSETFYSQADAEAAWQSNGRAGRVVQVSSGQDTTPSTENFKQKAWRWMRLGEPPPSSGGAGGGNSSGITTGNKEPGRVTMSAEDIQAVQSLRPAKNMSLAMLSRRDMDTRLAFSFMRQMNEMDLPMQHVAKKRLDDTDIVIPVKRRRVKVKETTTTVTELETHVETHTRLDPSRIPADEISVRPIRELNELSKIVPKRTLALPRNLLISKLLRREVFVRQDWQRVEEEETKTQAVSHEVTTTEPEVEEYVDLVPANRNPEGQLLALICDISPSMEELDRMELAAAAGLSVIGANRTNSSRYLYRAFTAMVGPLVTGTDEDSKRKLMQRILLSKERISSGTDITRALERAVADIREISNPDDRPEILLITDGTTGTDNVDALELSSILGDDITLHTVDVGPGNYSLRRYSTTYVHLSAWNGRVYCEERSSE